MQGSVLDEAAKVHPNSWWWIKADGCDLVTGLVESVRGEWSGDVNLHQEVLESLRRKYQERIEFTNGIGVGTTTAIYRDVQETKQCVIEDINFISHLEFKT